jgi:hypothetical protein
MKKQKLEIRKQKQKRQTWCVWVKHPLRYVNARSGSEARGGYLKILEKFPNDLAVLEYNRAKAMGLMA